MDAQTEEYELALRAQAGDTIALGELVERTRMRLFAQAYSDLRHYEDARDAVAAALLQICLHVGELRNPAKVRAWMQSVVRNECHRLRRGSWGAEVGLDEATLLPDREEPLILRLDIASALRRLPRSQARALHLFYLEDASIAEIAVITGRPEGTVKYWLHEGRQRLSKEMEDYRPMTTPTAAANSPAFLIHTDLNPGTMSEIQTALRKAGYTPRIITAAEADLLDHDLRRGQLKLLVRWTRSSRLLLLDEHVGSRSAFEILLNMSAIRELTPSGPRVCLLATNPGASTAFACWQQGVDLLVNKASRGEMASLAELFRRGPRSPNSRLLRLTARAKYVVVAARGVAAYLQAASLEPEHVALTILGEPGCAAFRLMNENGISRDRVRRAIRNELSPSEQAPKLPRDVTLHPRMKHLLDLAFAGAWREDAGSLSSVHLLLAILQEGSGPASRALEAGGVDPDFVCGHAASYIASELQDRGIQEANEAEAVALHEQYWAQAAHYAEGSSEPPRSIG
ncbi:MAG TPA: sigma-70 family RNA polymerase sigma factor [Armatimonadota bacterium]|nr:sigma-70 family RNA polymerase sigma factor [Armatimonadota bacterium]